MHLEEILPKHTHPSLNGFQWQEKESRVAIWPFVENVCKKLRCRPILSLKKGTLISIQFFWQNPTKHSICFDNMNFFKVTSTNFLDYLVSFYSVFEDILYWNLFCFLSDLATLRIGPHWLTDGCSLSTKLESEVKQENLIKFDDFMKCLKIGWETSIWKRKLFQIIN